MLESLEFKRISLLDENLIKPFLQKYQFQCSGVSTFTEMVSWERVYQNQWAIKDNTLILKFINIEDQKAHIMQPIGVFPLALQQDILHFAKSLPYRLVILGVGEEFMDTFPEFVSHFKLTELKGMFNYIYLADALANLPGRPYQAKRNLIHQFEKNNTWDMEMVTEANLFRCVEMVKSMYQPHNFLDKSYLSYELSALDFVLNNFQDLPVEGVMITIQGETVAFSLFEPLNQSTCTVCFEKAKKEYKGLYQLINRETAKVIFSRDYTLINREEDLGIEGLRKAKLSYHPVKLTPTKALVYKL